MIHTGGALEPLLKTPTFKYTVDVGRKTWVRALYPYAPYFFNIVKEIPWTEFKYENPDIIAKCSAVPYTFFGGAALELYDRDFKQRYSDHKYTLYDFVDPTGDIDIEVEPLVIQRKTTIPSAVTIIDPYTGLISNLYNNFSIWLFNHIVAYFTSLSPNFKEWFPLSVKNSDFVEPNLATNFEASKADLVKRVGPFTIIRTVLLNPQNILQSMAKIQVMMSVEIGRTHNIPTYYTSHFMEFVFQKNAYILQPGYDFELYNDVMTKNIYKTKATEYWLSNMSVEIFRNTSAMEKRIGLYSTPQLKHKFLNHFYRGLFMMILYDVAVNKDVIGFMDIPYSYITDFSDFILEILKSPLGQKMKSQGYLDPYKLYYKQFDPDTMSEEFRTMILNLPPTTKISLNNNISNIAKQQNENRESINSNTFNRILNNNSLSGGLRKTKRNMKNQKKTRRNKRTGLDRKRV